MRNHVVVSITDISGSRHLEIRKSILAGAAVICLLLAGSIPVLLAAVGSLHGDRGLLAQTVERLRREKALFFSESQHLQAEVGRIQQTLDTMDRLTDRQCDGKLPPSGRLLKAAAYMADREQEFRILENRIGRIESILGDGPVAADSLEMRVAAAGLDAELKKAVLDNLPNGQPIPMRGITSGFGPRVHPITGQKEFHKGVDLRAPVATPVHATADGVVEYAGLHRKSGLGNLLIIRHNFGFSTFYGHLQKILVKPGTIVRKGQKVALTGSSGLSNGPHLHYEIQYVYRQLDPAPYLSWDVDSWSSVFGKGKAVDWESIAALIQLRQAPLEKTPLQLARYEGLS